MAAGALLSEGSDEDGLDGVQAVLGLVEDDAGRGERNTSSVTSRPEVMPVCSMISASHDSVHVVVGGQAVHELDGGVVGCGHEGAVLTW